MGKNWKKIISDILLAVSLFSIGTMISGDYYYLIDDEGFLFAISFVILVRFLWKKIDNKFFK